MPGAYNTFHSTPHSYEGALEAQADNFGLKPASGASVLSVASNLWNTILGGGISLLALPMAANLCGLALFVPLVVLMAILAAYTQDLLVLSSMETGAQDYTSLMRCALGSWCAPVINFFLFAFLLGTNVTLLEAFVSSVMPVLGGSATSWVVLATCITLFVISMSRSLDSISPLSQFSFLLVIVFLGFVVWESSTVLDHSWHPAPIRWWPASATDVLNAVSQITFSFICHYNVLPIYSEIREPKRRGWLRALPMAMVSCTLCYCLCGVFSVFYHRGLQHNIFAEYATSIFGKCLSFLFGISFLVSIPLYQWVGTRSGLSLCTMCFPSSGRTAAPDGSSSQCELTEDWHGWPLQFGYIAFSVVMAAGALLTSRVDTVVTITSAVTAVPLMLVLPPLAFASIFWHGHAPDSSMHGLGLAVTLVVFGLVLWVGCLFSLTAFGISAKSSEVVGQL